MSEPKPFGKADKITWRWYQWTTFEKGTPKRWVPTCWEGETRVEAEKWINHPAAFGIFDGRTPACLVREVESYEHIIGAVYPIKV